MSTRNNIVAIIPARSGSRRLPGKNIKKIAGKPLIAHQISAALKTKTIDRVIVSTNSQKIASIAKKFGAETPFIRPKQLSTDKSKTVDVLVHAVNYLRSKRQDPEIIVLLQPTSPLTKSEDIKKAINTLKKNNSNSCVSMCEISDRPEWMFKIKKNIAYPLLLKVDLQVRTQDLKKFYKINGAIYVVKTNYLMSYKKIIDTKKNLAIIMPTERSIDIDTAYDFEIAKKMFKHL